MDRQGRERPGPKKRAGAGRVVHSPTHPWLATASDKKGGVKMA